MQTQRLFGTAGIRGVTNTGITAELALRVARAYGDWIHRHARKHAGEAGHAIARSAEPGEDWSWCFVDDVAFVVG